MNELLHISFYSIMNLFGTSVDTDIATFWVDVFSTIFFAATVGVLVWESILQKKAIMVDEYAELRQHHHDLITLQIEYPSTLEIYDKVKMPSKWQNPNDQSEIVLDEKEKRIYQVYVAEFDLYERVWLLKYDEQKKRKKQVTESEWLAWLLYLETISHHWLFLYAFNKNRTIFWEGFLKEIKEKIIDQEDAEKYLLSEMKKAYKEEEKGKELVLPDLVKLK